MAEYMCIFIHFIIFNLKIHFPCFHIHYIGFEKVERQQPMYFDNDLIVARGVHTTSTPQDAAVPYSFHGLDV